MDKIALERAVDEVAEELREQGDVVALGNDYGLSYITLEFADVQYTAHAWLYRGDLDYSDAEAQFPNATLDEAADACWHLLRLLKDWQAIGCRYDLCSIVVAVQRLSGKAQRYLFNVAGGVGEQIPDDPMIVFGGGG